MHAHDNKERGFGGGRSGGSKGEDQGTEIKKSTFFKKGRDGRCWAAGKYAHAKGLDRRRGTERSQGERGIDRVEGKE